jgi:kynurenine formamidase
MEPHNIFGLRRYIRSLKKLAEIAQLHQDLLVLPARNLILRKGIYQIEYLCNVHQINAKKVTWIALPLKLAGCEGAPARVIAMLD